MGNKLCLVYSFSCVWGSKVDVMVYNYDIKVLDSKTFNGYFVGSCKGSRVSGFYYSSFIIKIVKPNMVIYFDEVVT